jgi:hypothetical protein
MAAACSRERGYRVRARGAAVLLVVRTGRGKSAQGRGGGVLWLAAVLFVRSKGKNRHRRCRRKGRVGKARTGGRRATLLAAARQQETLV